MANWIAKRCLHRSEEPLDLSTRYVAPRTATEELLAGIRAGHLCVERVGIHDNFFELVPPSVISCRFGGTNAAGWSAHTSTLDL